MATIFTHPIIALGLKPLFSTVLNSKAVFWLGMLLTILPDIDVIGLKMGIPYASLFGHRGFTHSLFFAALIAAIISTFLSRRNKANFLASWFYLFLCTASHGVLDALTNGGHGVAFFSPFTNTRYFFSVTPIEVSTLNMTHFFQGQGGR
ncbi:MAG: metal-dependent hydrolase [Methyloprofundus sp.]|nr:metal-dependent hydrolase [Methyloprofundus sp.]